MPSAGRSAFASDIPEHAGQGRTASRRHARRRTLYALVGSEFLSFGRVDANDKRSWYPIH